MIRSIVLTFIRFYQKTISPDHGGFLFFIFPALGQSIQGVCKFRPTCSEYCYKAIEKYGVGKGMYKGIKRIIRCHPWSYGGWDPI